MLCSRCTEPVAPVVALDIDGTLGDYHGHLLKFAANYFYDKPWLKHPSVNYDGSTDLATFMGVSKEQYRAMKLAFRQGGMKRTLPVFPGAPEFTHQLRHRGIQIWICTTRPYNRLDNIDPDTQDFLLRNNFLWDYMIYDEDKYDELLVRIDRGRVVACIEDLPDKWDRAYELGLNPLLRQTRWNAAVHRTPSFRSYAEALSIIDERLAAWKE